MKISSSDYMIQDKAKTTNPENLINNISIEIDTHFPMEKICTAKSILREGPPENQVENR